MNLFTVRPGEPTREDIAGSGGGHRLHGVRTFGGSRTSRASAHHRQGPHPPKVGDVHVGHGVLRHRKQPGDQAAAPRCGEFEFNFASFSHIFAWIEYNTSVRASIKLDIVQFTSIII